MPATDDPVLKRFRAELEKAYGEKLDRVVLFGSRARGDARPDSDYDVAVFLNRSRELWTESAALADIGTEILLEFGRGHQCVAARVGRDGRAFRDHGSRAPRGLGLLKPLTQIFSPRRGTISTRRPRSLRSHFQNPPPARPTTRYSTPLRLIFRKAGKDREDPLRRSRRVRKGFTRLSRRAKSGVALPRARLPLQRNQRLCPRRRSVADIRNSSRRRGGSVAPCRRDREIAGRIKRSPLDRYLPTPMPKRRFVAEGP